MNMEWQSWFESMFLDPLTSFLDESIFRIDVFDTESAFIIEALIEEDRYHHVQVIPTGDELIISAVAKSDGATYSRKLMLPHITTPLRIVHQHSILEIFIDK
ncbi:Hsp20/alpha crystallin family protein [Cytobacillus kochii]|uniref:Hsp20/alpha crystallin family protein n=1 Tax=Cytobacillus kochii TaxID=859143 RepID=UPI00203E02F8|nr:Hsp20/alpha crystallin family protein [Cytobacillus kochii]MCM3321447.1 Hsp20/alpha crystallin family protein [Cytobacillus kochii]MCM3343719.1 Hsp20/alpha crystallin family protein [Cytobacillus kochii]